MVHFVHDPTGLPQSENQLCGTRQCKQQSTPAINVYLWLDHTLGSWCSQNASVQLTVSNCHYLCQNYTQYGRYLTATPIPQTRTHWSLRRAAVFGRLAVQTPNVQCARGVCVTVGLTTIEKTCIWQTLVRWEHARECFSQSHSNSG